MAIAGEAVNFMIETMSEEQTHAAQASAAGRFDAIAKRLLDIVLASVVLVAAIPLILCLAVAIKLESPGPVLFRCRRVGRRGRDFAMLKFRKMRHGARGPALTLAEDDRFTRIGRLLAATKLDELPQLWNVLRGDMSLVGPRPETREFVDLHPDAYRAILRGRPGITGLAQLAYAREGEILDPEDRVGDYVARVLPQKVALDQLYFARRTVAGDLRIVFWTLVAVVLRIDVAVDRSTARLGRRAPRVATDVATTVSQVPADIAETA
jgi:lipopolysaccharide/colanic/teichoic acid biosynthesis glycosyltransferase